MPTLLACLLFFSTAAQATTFGPMKVGSQVSNSDYIVEGQIQGSGWVLPESTYHRPYTYWKVKIEDQPKGAPLGDSVEIREPGGEINGNGYHVAGSATFNAGEEVYVVLRDTNESAKEVVSLSAGKYTVETGEGGQAVVRSGLGFVMKDADGQPYRPAQFTALLRRLANGTASAADKDVYLNKLAAHEKEDPVAEEHERQVQRSLKKAMEKISEKAPDSSPSPPSAAPAPAPPPAAAEPASVMPWVLRGAALLVLVLIAMFFLAGVGKR